MEFLPQIGRCRKVAVWRFNCILAFCPERRSDHKLQFSLINETKSFPCHFYVGISPCGGWVVLPYKRLMEMSRLVGSHFHDWIDYNGVAFSESFFRMGSNIFCFFGVRQFFIFTVCKGTRIFVL